MDINISAVIDRFIKLAVETGWLNAMDSIYTRNRLLAYLDMSDYVKDGLGEEKLGHYGLLDCLDEFVSFAVEKNIIENLSYQREIFEAKIMNLITPIPSEINRKFWELYETDPMKATDYFYTLSQANDYIKTRNIKKNIAFMSHTKYGELEITINLSKPEKDPKDILVALESASSNYPQCVLCMENEGYEGHANHAARENHRIVRLNVNDETYGFQYSPYIYYNEHSIFIHENHQPMIVNYRTLNNLFSIIDQLPHYFVGSNAGLPIVGGSILSHDHYQGGRHHFPIEKAKSFYYLEQTEFPEVSIDLVEWPMSTIRFKSQSKAALLKASGKVMAQWEVYDDENHQIISHTNNTRHNTVTPIARKEATYYVLDMVLRNNRTTEEFPDGLFHPHPDVHHIKKENIGLIEVMGLAILPPRLVKEMDEVSNFLLHDIQLDEVTEIHQDWAVELKKEYPDIGKKEVHSVLQQAIGNKFARVLEDAGLFKMEASGREGFIKFIESIDLGGE